MEKRGGTIEVRTTAGRKLVGHAALFGVETRISDPHRGSFREVIRPGAFDASITGDVLGLVDHDPARLLGRTKSGTLRLSTDTQGLEFEISLPDTTLGRDLLALAERGDVGGMSFGFDVPAGGDSWSDDLRELRAVQLFEISVVTSWPAYRGTTVDVRSLPIAAPAVSLRRRYLETLGG